MRILHWAVPDWMSPDAHALISEMRDVEPSEEAWRELEKRLTTLPPSEQVEVMVTLILNVAHVKWLRFTEMGDGTGPFKSSGSWLRRVGGTITNGQQYYRDEEGRWRSRGPITSEECGMNLETFKRHLKSRNDPIVEKMPRLSENHAVENDNI